jgi:hypothetical protein
MSAATASTGLRRPGDSTAIAVATANALIA